MSKIREGDLVQFTSVGGGKWSHLHGKFGIVMSRPREKPFHLTPQVISMIVVADVLVEDVLYEDVYLNILIKKI